MGFILQRDLPKCPPLLDPSTVLLHEVKLGPLARNLDRQRRRQTKHLLVPELALLAEASGVGGILVASVHAINAVVKGIAVRVGRRPLLNVAQTLVLLLNYSNIPTSGC